MSHNAWPQMEREYADQEFRRETAKREREEERAFALSRKHFLEAEYRYVEDEINRAEERSK